MYETTDVCPYCEHALAKVSAPKRGPKRRVDELLIKDGLPTVNEAINILHREIKNAKGNKIEVLKIIHGYGSSGKGGAIKVAVIHELSRMVDEHMIKRFITGEQHFEYAGKRNPLLSSYPELKESWVSDRGNPGITFVLI